MWALIAASSGRARPRDLGFRERKKALRTFRALLDGGGGENRTRRFSPMKMKVRLQFFRHLPPSLPPGRRLSGQSGARTYATTRHRPFGRCSRMGAFDPLPTPRVLHTGRRNRSKPPFPCEAGPARASLPARGQLGVGARPKVAATSARRRPIAAEHPCLTRTIAPTTISLASLKWLSDGSPMGIAYVRQLEREAPDEYQSATARSAFPVASLGGLRIGSKFTCAKHKSQRDQVRVRATDRGRWLQRLPDNHVPAQPARHQGDDGVRQFPPERIDVIVTYVDRWQRDITMYMAQLSIQIRDGTSRIILSTAESSVLLSNDEARKRWWRKRWTQFSRRNRRDSCGDSQCSAWP